MWVEGCPHQSHILPQSQALQPFLKVCKIGSITKEKPESCKDVLGCWDLIRCRKGAKALRSEYQVYCKTIELNQNNVKYAHLILQNNNNSKTQNNRRRALESVHGRVTGQPDWCSFVLRQTCRRQL